MEESKMIYCTSCGAENPVDSKFCSYCGTKIDEQTFTDELDIHYEDETIYSSTELFDDYYASDYIENTVEDELTSTQPTETPAFTYNYSTNLSSGATSNTNSNASTNGGGNIGFSITSMICGIVSILCCCTAFGFVAAIIAVVIGIIAVKSKYDGKGMAIAGIITGGIGIFVWIVFMIIGGFGLFLDILEY